MHDQSFYVIAAVNAVLCVVFVWRTAHFALTAPDCERLETREGRISSYSDTRSWYGTPELDLRVGDADLHVHAGPWLYRIRQLARNRAEVRVGLCPVDSRSRLWALWQAGDAVVTAQEQQRHARGVARATGTMALVFALAAALFFGAELGRRARLGRS